MRAARAVVSGSFALALLDRKSSAWRNPPRDLDIYLPKGQSKFLASYFVNEEKYRIIWKGGPRTSKNSSYPEGVASIIRLRRVSPMTGRNVFIELISSKDEVAMTPVLSFHSTPVMCALSADALFSPYPRLTHELQWGFINANCLRGLQTINAAAHSAINKYEDRGYILRTNCAYMPINGDDPTIQWLFAHRCEESYYCPHTSRSTGDRGCLKLRFDLAYEEEAVFHGSDAALWRLGGTVCFEMHTAGYTSFSSGAKRFYSKIFDDELDANDVSLRRALVYALNLLCQMRCLGLIA